MTIIHFQLAQQQGSATEISVHIINVAAAYSSEALKSFLRRQ